MDAISNELPGDPREAPPWGAVRGRGQAASAVSWWECPDPAGWTWEQGHRGSRGSWAAGVLTGRGGSRLEHRNHQANPESGFCPNHPASPGEPVGSLAKALMGAQQGCSFYMNQCPQAEEAGREPRLMSTHYMPTASCVAALALMHASPRAYATLALDARQPLVCCCACP